VETQEPLSDAKRRVLERLKRVDTTTAPELASEFGLTDTAVRQHLETLERMGMVERSSTAPTGRGRPPVRWRLRPAAAGFFPDRHGELTVELLSAVRDAFGDVGVEQVVAARSVRQQRAYREAIGPTDGVPVGVRLARLTQLRTAEGYLAELHADGDGFILTEHHCPISDAAEACRGLCRGELELFRHVLGPDLEIERTHHLLAGDARCSYRVRPAQTT
jgi:predicted ArsR family transcriptional regulator